MRAKYRFFHTPISGTLVLSGIFVVMVPVLMLGWGGGMKYADYENFRVFAGVALAMALSHEL